MKTVFGLLMLVAGCGGVNVSGNWSYAWKDRSDSTLHGTMILEQTGDQVTGSLGFPVDYPSPTPYVVAAWTWTVQGSVAGDSLPLSATGPDVLVNDPWRFDCVVSDDSMTGPAYSAGTPGYGFSATR